MDVYGIEALLGLPEFRVFDQVIRPTQLDLHLQRRDAKQHRLTSTCELNRQDVRSCDRTSCQLRHDVRCPTRSIGCLSSAPAGIVRLGMRIA
jgi:hypothetical protein